MKDEISAKVRELTLSRKCIFLLTLLSFLHLVPSCNFRSPWSEKPVIRIYDGRWESIYINNEIVKFIIETGYGYQVEKIELTTGEMVSAFDDDKIDVNIEMWKQNRQLYENLLKGGNVINIGALYESGPQFWIIPKSIAEKYKIKTVFDMKAHWKIFKNPDNPSRGVFYNGIPGWGATATNIVKMEAYGLDRYYDIIPQSSDAALYGTFERAQKENLPVFGYYWAPTPLIGAYEWYILEEPAYNEELWTRIKAASDNAALRPLKDACAYPDFTIDKIISKKLLSREPEIGEVLKKMMIGLDPLNRTLAWSKKNAAGEWEKAAVFYLLTYEEKWKTWVTKDAYRKIKAELKNKEAEGIYH